MTSGRTEDDWLILLISSSRLTFMKSALQLSLDTMRVLSKLESARRPTSVRTSGLVLLFRLKGPSGR